jgi:hypothetical protein
MTGRENNRPNELIEHAPVTLRRPLDFRPPAGSGTGVVWCLTR